MIPLAMFISMALFSPIWSLFDSGIVYTNQEKVKNKKEPFEVRSVGSWYMYLMKGYAGVAVIFSYYSFFIAMLEAGVFMFVEIILIPLMPIILTIAALPAIIILDLTTEHRTRYILKCAKKFGIIKNIEVNFKEID